MGLAGSHDLANTATDKKRHNVLKLFSLLANEGARNLMCADE